MPRSLAAVLGLGLMLTASGCGKSTSEVTGIVSLGSKPLTKGTVVFVDTTNLAHSADIGTDGRYTLTGVPSGAVKIYVYDQSAAATASGGSRPAGRGMRQTAASVAESPPEPAANPIPEKYGNAETSGLSTNLKAGKNEHNVEMN